MPAKCIFLSNGGNAKLQLALQLGVIVIFLSRIVLVRDRSESPPFLRQAFPATANAYHCIRSVGQVLAMHDQFLELH